MMSKIISLRLLFVLLLASFVIACKEKTVTLDVESVKGKYVDKIANNTILFEDGTSFKIDEKKYLKTFILTRHAEKDTSDKGPDPLLNSVGIKRSARLADILSGFRIDAIYSTMKSRTLFTVDSIGDLKSLPTFPYDNKDLKDLVQKVRSSLDKHNVLIVGHSNTIPVLTNYLYGEEVYKSIFDESDYDNLIIVFENIDSTKLFLPLKYK